MPMTDEPPTDESLIARAALADRAAFDILAGRYSLRLRRAAMRVLNDAAAAEDVAQDTLLRAWTKAASYRPGQGSVGAWLHRIAVNAAIDRLRTTRPSTELHEDLPDLEPGADLAIAGLQRQALLQEAIETLPLRQRAAVRMTYDEGWPTARAAAALDVSARALEGLLHRSRKALRAYLEAREG